MPDIPPVKIKRPDPTLWIERVVLYSKDNPWRILQDYSFRRGVNVIWGTSTTAKEDAARGHSVGKTTLIRLMRYALGEETYATKEDQDQIRYAFPRGHIGMTVHVGANVWSLVRCFGVNGADWAQTGVSLDNLLSGKNTENSYQDFRAALDDQNLKKWPFPHPPDSDRDYEWPHMLGWMARDQEARHRCFHIWRDKTSEAKMNAFRREKSDPLHFVRMVLDCTRKPEYDLEEAIAALDKEIQANEAKEQEAAAERHAQRVNLESLILAYVPQEERREQVAFDALKNLGQTRLKKRRDLANDAYGMADKALRTCQVRRLALDERVTQVTASLDLDGKKREFPKELNITHCYLARVPLADCKLFQARVARIKEEILAYESSSQAMEEDGRREFIEKKMEIATELAELRKQERRLMDKVAELTRKSHAAEAELQHFDALWKLWEPLSLPTAMDGEASKNAQMVKAKADKKRKQTQLERLQLDCGETYQQLDDLYRTLCQSVLGTAYSGTVEYPPRADYLTFFIHEFGRKANGAAVTTLGSHLADITALLWAAAGNGCHPGLLIHDSPREADMTDRIYADYLKGIHHLAEVTGGENAPFQYIFSTTTEPPIELKDRVRVHLAGYPENQLLFKCRLGRTDELPLEPRA